MTSDDSSKKQPSISRHCESCQKYHTLVLDGNVQELKCPECPKPWGRIEDLQTLFNACPVCGCRQFYVSKDFNQLTGCLIMLVGIVLVPWTYGLSLPVMALIDFLLSRRVDDVINCYRCGCEFRNIPTEKTFKPFMHHIGLKYDK